MSASVRITSGRYTLVVGGRLRWWVMDVLGGEGRSE